jgi:hypothetical protein
VERAVVKILTLLLGLLGFGIVAVLLKMFAGKSLKTLFADQDKSTKLIYGLAPMHRCVSGVCNC